MDLCLFCAIFNFFYRILCCKSNFSEFFNTEIFHLQPCRFAYIQIGIQTAHTRFFRQLRVIFFCIIINPKLAVKQKDMWTGWNLNSKWPTEMLSHLNELVLVKCTLFTTWISNQSVYCSLLELASEGRDFHQIMHFCSGIRVANPLTTCIICIWNGWLPFLF